MTEKIVLASTSPRRKQLLEWAEIPFEVVTADTDETFPPGMDLRQAATHIAMQKALNVKNILDENRTVVAADTIVVLNGKQLGKPKDRVDAINILTQLQGNTHQVVTGVAILNGEKQVLFHDSTEVVFHKLTPQQIIFYVDKYQPYDKAGAYAIQEWIGVVGIKSVKGDFYNVMGLPVSRVILELDALKNPFRNHDEQDFDLGNPIYDE
ncbi:MAG: septum formation protein Maf [Niabella sp. SCN 42-15]|nr:MAG: septum formation protein Maf [Niabella sp. SCN 42-15]